jgi:hypothetical protein
MLIVDLVDIPNFSLYPELQAGQRGFVEEFGTVHQI